MRALVIPEDPKLDRYIVKPVVQQLLADAGKPNARVEVLERPRLRGVAQALDAAMISSIVENNPMADLVLVMVDRDADRDRASVARAREAEHPDHLLVCLAIEEVEVWMLALHKDVVATDSGARWQEVRAEQHPKERFASPFLERHAPQPDPGPGDGRVWAMREIGSKWKSLTTLCPEVGELGRRIAAWIGEHPR